MAQQSKLTRASLDRVKLKCAAWLARRIACRCLVPEGLSYSIAFETAREGKRDGVVPVLLSMKTCL